MPRELFSIICDDVRFEQGNKLSFMGVYTEGILVSDLPFVMPKLCLFVYLDECQDTRRFKVALRGPKVNVPPVELKPSEHGKPKVRLTVALANVKFEQEGDYRLDIFFDDDKEATVTKPFYVKLRPELRIE
jgi:hypothetical protein